MITALLISLGCQVLYKIIDEIMSPTSEVFPESSKSSVFGIEILQYLGLGSDPDVLKIGSGA